MDRLIVLMLVVFVVYSAKNQNSDIPDKPDDGGQVKVDESKVWSEFAEWVERNPAGSVNDTDHVVQMGQSLKSAGLLSDISRLDQYAQKFSEIDSSNRKQIADTIRGN